jgi:hypothetical protein
MKMFFSIALIGLSTVASSLGQGAEKGSTPMPPEMAAVIANDRA